VTQQRLSCGPHHEIVSDDNEFTVRWRRRFDWKARKFCATRRESASLWSALKNTLGKILKNYAKNRL
jgi:hypothetical protein